MIRCVFFLSMSVCSDRKKYIIGARTGIVNRDVSFFPSVPSAWLTFDNDGRVVFEKDTF